MHQYKPTAVQITVYERIRVKCGNGIAETEKRKRNYGKEGKRRKSGKKGKRWKSGKRVKDGKAEKKNKRRKKGKTQKKE